MLAPLNGDVACFFQEPHAFESSDTRCHKQKAAKDKDRCQAVWVSRSTIESYQRAEVTKTESVNKDRV